MIITICVHIQIGWSNALLDAMVVSLHLERYISAAPVGACFVCARLPHSACITAGFLRPGACLCIVLLPLHVVLLPRYSTCDGSTTFETEASLDVGPKGCQNESSKVFTQDLLCDSMVVL